MKYFLRILFFGIILGFIAGFYLKPDDPKTGNLIIGLSVCTLFFVLMPLFVYHRWRKKDLKDYMLTKENKKKMMNHEQDKKG